MKEALAIAGAGFEVVILNTVVSQKLSQEDSTVFNNHPRIQIKPVADLTRRDFSSFADRAVFKLGALLASGLNVQSFWALGYGALRYFRCCKAVKADLYICHQELATYTGSRLLKAGFNVAFDLEDWYSEDLLPAARAKRPLRLLRSAEFSALRYGAFCTTTSHAMADQLCRRYESALPAVVYNVFPKDSGGLPEEKVFDAPLKLFWFSQTIGPGRGIEEFIRLSGNLSVGHELHLLGNVDAGYRERLCLLMPEQHLLFFHPLVKEKELAARIADFDIGLALELPAPPSRNYTITNKFFQYIEAGLPVIATATAGQQEIFEEFTPGFLLPLVPLPSDIRNLDSWLNDQQALRKAQRETQKASLFYNWESQAQIMLALIQKSIV
ncbi:hypothetical protein QWZ17_26345 [Mucilaginibacter flavus]|nr:hypothetical protein [Mucilaginibacter flavus]